MMTGSLSQILCLRCSHQARKGSASLLGLSGMNFDNTTNSGLSSSSSQQAVTMILSNHTNEHDSEHTI